MDITNSRAFHDMRFIFPFWSFFELVLVVIVVGVVVNVDGGYILVFRVHICRCKTLFFVIPFFLLCPTDKRYKAPEIKDKRFLKFSVGGFISWR